MIVADQLRHDCTGFCGAGLVHTPNIDRIARRGRGFTNAFTAVPTCCPARQSLLTGRRPESLGALWNWDISLPVGSIDPSVFTWTRALQEAGYRGAYFGKWHVSEHHDPTAFGFEHYVGLSEYTPRDSAGYPTDTRTFDWRGGVDPQKLEETRTHWLAGLAQEFLTRHARDEEPFLMRVDFSEPHLPCSPVEEFARRHDPASVPPWPSFADDFAGKPYIQLQQLYNWGIESYTWSEWAPVVARYLAIIEQMDDAIGRILDTLERAGAFEDTVVVFTSDHGDMTGAHRMVDKHYVMYDDVVRVPLAICGPGIAPSPEPVTEFVTHTLDLAPTLLELADVTVAPDVEAGFHGRSLVPLLHGERPAGWPEYVVSSYNGQQFGLYNQRMIRTAEWKYVWNPTDQDELYHLGVDPSELHNRIADAPADLVEGLRRQLYEELVRGEDGLVRNDWLRAQLLEGRKLVRAPAAEGGEVRLGRGPRAEVRRE